MYSTEFYPAVKKKKITEISGKWMELEKNILNEVTQAPKIQFTVCSLICDNGFEVVVIALGMSADTWKRRQTGHTEGIRGFT